MRSKSIWQALPLLLVVLLPAPALAASTFEVREGPRGLTVDDLERQVITSSSTGDASKKAQRFYLYGGPGTTEGTFQNALGQPDWQGWTSEDPTYDDVHWHVSDFNAGNLNGHGAGNMAMWCGDNPPTGWVNPPGYGNGWRDPLVWRSGPLADPSVGRTIGLDFYFNHETEPGYDFFMVEYQTGSTWTTVYAVDGTNKSSGTFAAPGVQYSTLTTPPIAYAGNDYGGEGGDEIVLRLYVTSDGAFSNEDGFHPTTAGAAQVDDITVSYDDGGPVVDFTDFEGGGPFSWQAELAPFVGDFAKIRAGLTEPDPCRQNLTPQMTFIDDGSSPNNAPGQSTGGSTSPQWSYGVPGGWTTNDTGGLAGPDFYLTNIVVSPGFPIDLPGPEDDGPHFKYVMEWEAFEHHPLIMPSLFPRVFYSNDGELTYLQSRFPASFYYSVPTPPRYYDRSIVLHRTDVDNATHLKAGLYFSDGRRSFPGMPYDATPAPFLDNVLVYKESSGPLLSANHWELFQDAFPTSGGLDVTTQAARDALDVPLDGADANAYGDGNAAVMTLDRLVTYPFTTYLEMHWILDMNPLFEQAIRTLPAGTTVSAGTGPNGWDQAMGTSTGTDASPNDDRYWFDLPDQDFFYPGDQLRYYFWAQSTDGTPGPESTLPTDISGFSDGTGYDPWFTVRALPRITDASGTQPEILLVDYDQNGDAAKLWDLTLGQLGLEFDRDIDVFLGRGLDANLANAGYGATASQLGGYSCILVSNRSWPHVDDYTRLQQWHAEPGDRLAAYFGDDVVTAAPASYRTDVMAVQFLGSSVLSLVGNQSAPPVIPQQAPFVTSFAANASCYLRGLDAILPDTGAVTAHGYDDGMGGTYASAAASVLHDRLDGEGDRIIDVTFPYALGVIEDEHAKGPGASARAELVAEVLGLMGHAGGPPTPAPVPALAGIHDLVASPNPFNPRTEIGFRLGRAVDTRVRVFDLRGRHVLDLHRGPLAAGAHGIPWSGLDAQGTPVASGVYFVQVKTPGHEKRIKITLIE